MMVYFASKFYRYSVVIKSTLFFCGIFIILWQSKASQLETELKEESSFNARQILKKACHDKVAPKMYIDYTHMKHKDKALEEVNKSWFIIVEFVEKLNNKSVADALDHLAEHLYALDLADEHFLKQQKESKELEELEELEDKKILNSNSLSLESQEPFLSSKLETIVDIEEDSESQNHQTTRKDDTEVQKTFTWKNFYFLVKKYFFLPFITKFNFRR